MILNLTQHPATPEQREAGVVDVPAEHQPALKELLTFDFCPEWAVVELRAASLTNLAWDVAKKISNDRDSVDSVMIGGAPYLMVSLARELGWHGLQTVYAYSTRESIEEPQPDGSVAKRTVFRHAGFVRQESV